MRMQRLMVVAAVGLLAFQATGCGRTSGLTSAAALAAAKRNAGVAAQGVAPDQDKVIAEDLRRAKYWAEDARWVMAIQEAKANSQIFTSAANVFYSPSRADSGQTAVLAVRRTALGLQANAMNDFANLAAGLQALEVAPLKAAEAWSLARRGEPAPAAPNAPVVAPVVNPLPQPVAEPVDQPSFALQQAAPVAGRSLWGARLVLARPAGRNPEQPAPMVWRVYSGSMTTLLDASNKRILGTLQRDKPNDPLAIGQDVALERAAAAWLPGLRTAVEHPALASTN